MSMTLSNSVSPARVSGPNAPFAIGHRDPVWLSTETTAGYAFETALCLIESQSPLLRPLFEPGTGDPAAERHTEALSSRIRQLTTLLDHLDGTLDADETRELLQAAGRVTGELIAVFGPSVDSRAIDPAVSRADRSIAADSLARARLLALRISRASQGRAPVRFAA